MGVPESADVVTHRLLARDYGPELAVILPREHWMLVSALLAFVHDEFGGLDPTPVGYRLDEMREYASMKVARAIEDAVRADRRGEFGG